MTEIKKIRKVAINAAVKAGKYALSRVEKIKEISRKDGINNLVTDVDKSAEKIIIDSRHKVFSHHFMYYIC